MRSILRSHWRVPVPGGQPGPPEPWPPSCCCWLRPAGTSPMEESPEEDRITTMITLKIAFTSSSENIMARTWAAVDTLKLHPQATALGAPLETGRDLYPELQQAYRA